MRNDQSLIIKLKIIQSIFYKAQFSKKMSNMFDIDFDNDSAEEKEVVTQMSQSILANNSAFKQSQSVVLNSDKKQNDKYIPNQISKNILFYQVEDDLIHLGEEEKSEKNQNILESPKKQTSEKKTIRRKKVDTKIKLQPLKTLDLVKKTQAISLITSPVLKKTQSLQPSYQPKQFQQSNLDLTSVQKEKVLNFQMGDSSQEEQNSDSINNFKTPTKKENQNPHKLNLELSANVFFQDSDYQKNSDDNKEDQQNEQNRPNKNNKSLEKKRSTKKNDLQESEQKQQTISQCGQNEKDDSDSENAKVGIQQEPNPQISKKYINQPNNEITQQQYLNTINGQKSQQKSQFDNLKSLLLDTLMKNSVLNLKLRRKQSLLNFFSPQFRIEFLQDKYFIMNSKKTSSKPSSTFIFSGSEINYDQTSRRFLGKMKSNIGGSVYNIYGPGLNPSDAKDKNLPPRQLLATVFYKTQFMGTSRPKQLIVYAKKPQYLYYRDFRGVRMYDEEIPLNKLYNFYPENKQKIHVFKTRRPHFHPEKRQYVMNFEGKVKISSVKNFILEDRSNGNQKVLLFGKITQNDFILDIHSPLTPIVGIGVALTMFDSRMGSE